MQLLLTFWAIVTTLAQVNRGISMSIRITLLFVVLDLAIDLRKRAKHRTLLSDLHFEGLVGKL